MAGNHDGDLWRIVLKFKRRELGRGTSSSCKYVPVPLAAPRLPAARPRRRTLGRPECRASESRLGPCARSGSGACSDGPGEPRPAGDGPGSAFTARLAGGALQVSAAAAAAQDNPGGPAGPVRARCPPASESSHQRHWAWRIGPRPGPDGLRQVAWWHHGASYSGYYRTNKLAPINQRFGLPIMSRRPPGASVARCHGVLTGERHRLGLDSCFDLFAKVPGPASPGP